MDDISHTQWAVIILVIFIIIVVIIVAFWHWSRIGAGIGPTDNTSQVGSNNSILSSAGIWIVLVIIIIIIIAIAVWYYESADKIIPTTVITPV
jgi:uncharacterized membrane protein